jgi:hypothetical protein
VLKMSLVAGMLATAIATSPVAQADSFSDVMCYDLKQGITFEALAQSLADTTWTDGSSVSISDARQGLRAMVAQSCPEYLP